MQARGYGKNFEGHLSLNFRVRFLSPLNLETGPNVYRLETTCKL